MKANRTRDHPASFTSMPQTYGVLRSLLLFFLSSLNSSVSAPIFFFSHSDVVELRETQLYATIGCLPKAHYYTKLPSLTLLKGNQAPLVQSHLIPESTATLVGLHSFESNKKSLCPPPRRTLVPHICGSVSLLFPLSSINKSLKEVICSNRDEHPNVFQTFRNVVFNCNSSHCMYPFACWCAAWWYLLKKKSVR